MTETYARGSKTVRVKTARLIPGDRVLTNHSTDRLPVVSDAQNKTGAVIRTVERLDSVIAGRSGFHQRAQRQYTVFFTDGTFSPGHAPIYTWHALVSTPAKELLP